MFTCEPSIMCVYQKPEVHTIGEFPDLLEKEDGLVMESGLKPNPIRSTLIN